MINTNYEKTEAEVEAPGERYRPPSFYPPPSYDANGIPPAYPTTAPPMPPATTAGTCNQMPLTSMPPAYGFDAQLPPPPPGAPTVVSEGAYNPGNPYGGQSYGHYNHQQQQTVVVQQPGTIVWRGGPLENPPNDYMGYSIFVTLCCCWLVGIFAIMGSSECRAAIAAGDRATAETKSREARRKANIALALGIISLIIAGTIVGVYYGLVLSNSPSYSYGPY